jgi:putative peptide zinc metalloprotease protein
MQESGFKDRQYLIQREGRFIQLTELLYRVVERANGERTVEEIAAGVTESTDWLVSADNVRYLIQTKLIPLGLIMPVDGGAIVSRGDHRVRSALQVKAPINVLGARAIDPVARVLQVLFAPLALVPVVLIAATAFGWLFLVHGVADSVRAALYTPGGILIVLVAMLAAGVFHEFGHAAALRYGGGRARGMGVGLYLVYPTFYTDTTDAYRLGKWARVRTDLGGVYFHLIFALGLMGLYFVSGEELLLAIALLVSADILYQFFPFVRLDGYWVLADLTGIPDFFSQMGPFMRSVLPSSGQRVGALPRLKPWVTVVFAIYIVITVPLLAFLFFMLLRNTPRFIEMSWASLLYQARVLAIAQNSGDFLVMAAVLSQMLLLTLAMLATVYLIYSAVLKPAKALWNWSKPTFRRRVASVLVAMTVIVTAATVLAFLWTPYLPSASSPVPTGVQSFEVSEQDHVQTLVSYPQNPPAGGNHNPIWQNCGFYSKPVHNEYAVHSMEHGAVWITYRTNLPTEQVRKLKQLAHSQTYILVSPYPGLPSPVVASAWGKQLRLESANAPRLEQFVRAFRQGPQTPEPGATCTGGTSAAASGPLEAYRGMASS